MSQARDDTPLPLLELTCFGPPTARVGGEEPAPEVVWRKNLALLIYLALSPGPRSRDHLLGLLWPEKPQELARRSLNTAVYSLRAHLGADRLISSGDAITLNASELAVDALRFEVEVRRDAARAAAIPRGAFLEGFAVEDAPGFEEWASNQRTRLHSVWASALMERGEAALAESDFGEAEAAARQAVELQPLSDSAVDLLLRTAAHTRDVTAAVAAYREYEARLHEATGAPPNARLRRLLDRVVSGDWHPPVPAREPEPPLVGREGIHRRAFALVEQVKTAGAQALVIQGEPGLGKTRLLDECMSRLALAGAAVEIARPLEGDRDIQWSTLRMLMRGGLGKAPGVAATDPGALATLAALVPELAKRFPAEEPRDNAQVAAALAALIQAVSEEQPVGIAVDNAEAADGATLEALNAAIRQVRDRPVMLLIATSASGTAPPPELARLRSEVGRGIPGAAVQLKPLDHEAMGELVRHLADWCRTPEELDRLTRRVASDTMGNPFFAVTILRALASSPTMKDDVMRWPTPRRTYETPLPFTMPDLVRMAVVARVATLQPETVDVLRAASVGDVALDVALIANLTGRSEAEVEATLDELERQSFVSYDGNRHTWAAPFTRQAVEAETLTHGGRQRLRRKALALLSERTDLPSAVLRVEMLAKLEPGPATATAAMGLAERAVTDKSYRLARRALAVAQDQLSDTDRKGAAHIRKLRKRIPE